MPERKSSRLSGFYSKPLTERIAVVSEWADLSAAEIVALAGGLTPELADQMVENAVGLFALPLGVGVNLLINERDYLAPMVVEEPSVIAAVGNAARLARAGGGFQTGSTPSVMIGQVQLLDVPDLSAAAQAVLAAETTLGKLVDSRMPSMVTRGGGFRGVEVRPLADTPAGPMLIVHLLIDCVDAMGANVVNTATEAAAALLESLTGGRVNLRILSNLTDQRRAWATCTIPVSAFGTSQTEGLSVAKGIAEANAFAWADPYRAATHNKGIMNGIDPMAIATGNDWRAIEAGAHAYAARDGQYRALTDWRLVGGENEPALFGRIELPLAVGIVGGATRVHPAAQTALKILGVTTARELAEVMAAVGLAQNLGALRALVTEGIQRGHMALHARQAALAAGVPADEVEQVAAQLVAEENVKASRAAEIWAALRGENNEQ